MQPVMEVDPMTEVVPIGQLEQEVDPATSAYVLAGHLEQEVEPVEPE